jgi:hypothetical protein
MTTYSKAMMMPKRQAIEALTTKPAPFTQEQLGWLRNNLEVTVHKDYDGDTVVRLYLEREMFCEAYS